jgi:hypothetical protein
MLSRSTTPITAHAAFAACASFAAGFARGCHFVLAHTAAAISVKLGKAFFQTAFAAFSTLG